MTTAAGPVIPDFGHGSSCVTSDSTFCWDWVRQHWGDTLGPALVQHLELTAIAVGIGFAISLALALLAHRFRPLNAPFAVVAALLYTIPSLALFQVLVPITGITWTTVEIGLVGKTERGEGLLEVPMPTEPDPAIGLDQQLRLRPEGVRHEFGRHLRGSGHIGHGRTGPAALTEEPRGLVEDPLPPLRRRGLATRRVVATLRHLGRRTGGHPGILQHQMPPSGPYQLCLPCGISPKGNSGYSTASPLGKVQ